MALSMSQLFERGWRSGMLHGLLCGGMWAAKAHRLEQLLMKHQHPQCAAQPRGSLIAANRFSILRAGASGCACLVLRRVCCSMDILPGVSQVS